MQNDLTRGSVFNTIVRFSLPYFAAYFLQTFYGLADLFITGQFNGADAITAVSGGSQIMHFVTVVIVGLSVGATVMIGHAVGMKSRSVRSQAQSKSDERIGRIIGNTVTVFTAAALVMTLVLLFSARMIIRIMQVPPEAEEGMQIYLMICFAGIPFITAYNVIAAVFRGLGDSRTPMIFVAVACMLNIGLDYLFIGGFSMGAAGAALGTIIAQTVSVLIALLWIARKNSGIRMTRRDLVPEYDLRYRLSADYDWCIKVLKRSPLNSYAGDEPIISYLADGMTTRHHRASLWERYRIMCQHYGTLPATLAHLSFIPRYLKRRFGSSANNQ